MSYQTITETFSTLDECSSQDFDYDVSIRFTPLGLTQYGTLADHLRPEPASRAVEQNSARSSRIQAMQNRVTPHLAQR